jgi:Ca2+/H+ antiporter
MNTLFRSTVLAAMFILPTAAFAQSVVQVDETPVEMIAYEVAGPDSAPAQAHAGSLSNPVGTHAGALPDTQFNPAADVGLNSIYLRH